ncbi:MAG: hypothetical protein AB7G11_10585 [Phycisphaerales bacterium]
MRTFIFVLAMMYGVLLAVTAYLEYDELRLAYLHEWATLALEMWIVPVAAAWLTAEAIHAMAPRRAFDRRARATSTRGFAGAIAGTLGIGLGVLMVSIPQGVARDTVLMGTASLCATLIVTLSLKRLVRSACVHCGYDLRGNAGAAVCPECGKGVMASS